MDSVLIAREHLSDAQRAARDALLEAEAAFEVAHAGYRAAFADSATSTAQRCEAVERWRAAFAARAARAEAWVNALEQAAFVRLEVRRVHLSPAGRA